MLLILSRRTGEDSLVGHEHVQRGQDHSQHCEECKKGRNLPRAHQNQVLGDEARETRKGNRGQAREEPQTSQDGAHALHTTVLAHVLGSASPRQPAGQQEHRGD